LVLAALLIPACSSGRDAAPDPEAAPVREVAVAPAAGSEPAAADSPVSARAESAVESGTSRDQDPRNARSIGSATAPITMYEMSDFQCPYCRRHAVETHPKLLGEYVDAGKLRIVFINFPITSLHPNAVPAAELALCAARAGRFWDAHAMIFRHQQSWAALPDAAPYFLSLADSLGLPRAETVSCLQDPAILAAVRQEAEGAVRAGARSTPTFYIEGGLLEGAQPMDVFRPILDSIYAVKAAAR